jgi:hypothetical protein
MPAARIERVFNTNVLEKRFFIASSSGALYGLPKSLYTQGFTVGKGVFF